MKPINHVLDRDQSKQDITELKESICPVLDLLIFKCAEVADMVVRKLEPIDLDNFPIFSTFFHIIEMTDASQVLCENGCSAPIILLNRCILESFLELDYLVLGLQTRLLWTYIYFRKIKERNEKLLPDTDLGKEFSVMMQVDETFQGLEMSKYGSCAKKSVTEVDGILSDPVFQIFHSTISEKPINKDWYTYLGGPRNLKELSKVIKRGGLYSSFYHILSDSIHGRDGQRFIRSVRSMETGGRIIRNCIDLPFQINLTFGFCLMSATCFCTYYKIMDDFASWYKTELHTKYIDFANKFIHS